MTTLIVSGIACFWLGVWVTVWCKGNQRADDALMARHREVVDEQHELILTLANADRKVAQLQADLADAYDVIAIQRLMTTKAGREKRVVLH